MTFRIPVFFAAEKDHHLPTLALEHYSPRTIDEVLW
jgi:hypothetical protein